MSSTAKDSLATIPDAFRNDATAPTALPEIVLYEHTDFNSGQEGWVFRTNLRHDHLGDLNDQASSCVVVSGTWRLYDEEGCHEDTTGKKADFAVGYYNRLEDHGIDNDTLTSLRPI
jgi:hypothetical protein